MRNRTVLFLSLLAALVGVAGLTVGPACAQARTTPVEVQNSPTVKIDPVDNGVRAAQGGTWNVGISGTPSVSVSNNPVVRLDSSANTVKMDATQNVVRAAQTGTWNVGINGTPTVGIDSAANTVKTPTQSNKIQLWASNQAVPSGGDIYGPEIVCDGYRDIRLVVFANTGSSDVKLHVFFRTGTGSSLTSLGWANFATPSKGITDMANFQGYPTVCAFTIPVMSDRFQVRVVNDSAASITLSEFSWAYLVN